MIERPDFKAKKWTILIFLVLAAFSGTAQEEEDEATKPAGESSTLKTYVFASTTFSVKHRESENVTRLFQPLDDSYRLDWEVTLRSGYFIKDNFAVGGYFKYAESNDRIQFTNDEGPVLDEAVNRSYSIAPFMRNYLRLGKSTFYLFNETNLEFTYGSGVRQVNGVDDINRNTTDSYALKLGIQPGITAFITDVVSFEVGTSVLGLSSEYTRTTTNGIEEDEGYTWSNEVSFEIDLLSLFLGLTFYFPTK
jgi:hypothetical protein